MSDPAKDKAHIRSQLTEMLRRVPASIASAGVEQTRAFKRFHERASKTVQANRGTLNDWQTLYTQAQAIYQ